ncbi:hypothetical protein [Nostoc edaphicum]
MSNLKSGWAAIAHRNPLKSLLGIETILEFQMRSQSLIAIN